MKRLTFSCELLSDLILTQHAASEGASRTLDFIPGSNFLGIVASKLYQDDGKDGEKHRLDMLDLFHSGKVRFGDAHLAFKGQRSLKVPSSLFYPKLQGMTGTLYIHHAIPNPAAEELRKLQLKQCRSGFYVFDGESARKVDAETSCAIKSAYDKNRRCAKDEQLYVYESLRKGVKMYFEIEIDDDSRMNTSQNIERIIEALCGKKRIGRSRTAQFGLVQIEQVSNYDEVKSNEQGTEVQWNGQTVKCVIIYADSRLIFMDKYGLPTYQPTAIQLGLPDDAEILWEKSQIRTFQYSPWNYKRQSFDADRCGLEKGSVIVVRCPSSPSESQYVGSYRNEGFGRVIYNPSFLKASKEGIAQISLKNEEQSAPVSDKTHQAKQLLLSDDILLQYIGRQMLNENMELAICEAVNKWVEKNSILFNGESFAAQWGTIRKLAMLHSKEEDLLYRLFGERIGKYKQCSEEEAAKNGYLTHGVASSKWAEKGRIKELKNFCTLFSGNLQKALINLASEMGKQCYK